MDPHLVQWLIGLSYHTCIEWSICNPFHLAKAHNRQNGRYVLMYCGLVRAWGTQMQSKLSEMLQIIGTRGLMMLCVSIKQAGCCLQKWLLSFIANISKFLSAKVAKNSPKWALMVEPSILNVFIKIKHHFVKINLHSSRESYQPITFTICCQTGNGWKQQPLMNSPKPFNNVA